MNKKFWIRFAVMMAIIFAIFALDLVTKYVFDGTLSFNETKTIIPYLFNFKLVHNIGAAWGVLAGKQVFLIALSLVFLAIFIAYYVKEKNKTWLLNVTFGFLIGGCLGNLYDRIFIGYVRDFIQFDFWKTFPVFNFADAALTIGVVLFVVYLVLYFVRLKKEERQAGISVENFSEDKNADTFKEKVENKNLRTKTQKNLKKAKKTKQNVEEIEDRENTEGQKNAKNAAKMQKKIKYEENKNQNGEGEL